MLSSLWKRLGADELSVEILALSVAVGFVLGVFPVLGFATPLCAGAALLFRLNLPAVQLANYVAAPLQLALLMPFIRLGERWFHTSGPVRANVWISFGNTALHTVAAWFGISVPVGILLYLLLRSLLQEGSIRRHLRFAR